jgi:hypothetical protein
MKKSINKIIPGCILFVSLMTFLPSCLDLTEVPENMMTSNNFYENAEQCQAVLVSTMNNHSSQWSGYYGTPEWPCGQYDRGRLGYSPSQFTGIWLQHYRATVNINRVIQSIKNGKLKNEINQTTVNDILGQAYFLRAWNYFWFVQLYGKIPYNDENTPDLVAHPLTHDSRLDIDKVYDRLETDLNEAFRLMNDYKTSEKGRPCKWTAKAWLAKVYLTRATAPLNDAACFAKAAAAADEVIKNGPYELLPVVEIFNTANLNNSELIHAFQFTNDYPAYPGPSTGPEADWDTWGEGKVKRIWAERYPEQPRKHYYLRTWWPRNLSVANAGKPEDWDWLYYDDHPNEGERYPWDGKKTWPNLTAAQNLTDGGNSGILLPILRISEMYLIYAEAANMANNSGSVPQLAVDRLNVIIQRANQPFESKIPATSVAGHQEEASASMTKEEFHEKVFLERQWELCFEFTAYFDLLRTRRLKEWNEPVVSQNFKETDYLFPIPALDATFIGNNKGYGE